MSNRVVLIGAVHEAAAALTALGSHAGVGLVGVVTLTAEAGSQVSGFVDLAPLADASGAPVVRTVDVNDASTVAAIRSLSPDLIAVVGWTRLIGEDVLAVPRVGCIGFHASLLPHGRGRAPVNWSIIRGERRTGNTMMLLDAGVDTGLVVDQRATPIYADDNCATVYDRVGRLGAEMLHDNVVPLLEGTARPSRQDEAAVTTFGKRVPEMGVVDWRRSPGEVHDWVRAQTRPYPGAFSTLGDQRVRLWRTEVPRWSEESGQPGEVLAVAPDHWRVATGDAGSVRVTDVGLDDSPSVGLAYVAARLGLRVGSRFELPRPEVVAWSLGLGPRPGSVS